MTQPIHIVIKGLRDAKYAAQSSAVYSWQQIQRADITPRMKEAHVKRREKWLIVEKQIDEGISKLIECQSKGI